MKLCECGCGQELPDSLYKGKPRRYINYHFKRKRSSSFREMKLCECGCGQLVTKEKNRFLNGHGRRCITDEERKKISLRVSGKNHPMFGKHGKDNPNTGSHRTDEQKKHIADSLRGKPRLKGRGVKRSDEWRRKQALSHKGIIPWCTGLTKETDKRLMEYSLRLQGEGNPMFGKSPSNETRKKLHISSTKNWEDSEYREKVFKGLRETGNVCGNFFSMKNNKDISYRSSYELKYMQQLEEDERVIVYQYEAVYVPYEIGSKYRFTMPDFLITFADGHKELSEVKSEWCLKDNLVMMKLAAMKNHAEQNGWKFNLVTEKELGIEVR
jgi:hypothetical protein